MSATRLHSHKSASIRDESLAKALGALLARALEAARVPVGWIAFLEAHGEPAAICVGTEAAGSALDTPGAARCEAQFIDDAAAGAFASHPWVAGEPHARFIGAVPLVASGGARLGSLVVIDRAPRTLTPRLRNALSNLAALAAARIEAAGAAIVVETEGGDRRQDAGERLATEREFSSAVIASLESAFLLISPEGLIRRWNAALVAATGYPEAQIAAMSPPEFFSARDRAPLERAMQEVLQGARPVTLEAELVDAHGNVRPCLVSGKPVRLGGRGCMILLARDITLRKRNEQQIARQKERLDLALSSSNLALWDWDLQAQKVYFNESWASLLGSAPRESTFSVEQVLAWNHPDDRPVFQAAIGNAIKGVSEEFDCEYRVGNAGGDWVWIHSRGKVTQRDAAGAALRMTGTSTDVTKRKAAEERAEYLATRDPLTGLPNRVLLHDRLEQGVMNASRNRAGFAFMFIDLDRFKTINDSLGHQVGDGLLKQVAARLQACVRASDTVARLGGDEFAVILENLRDDDDEGAQQVAEKMIAALGAPMLIDGQHLNTSCSIGISLYPADGRDGATLMKHADVAMYYAKEKGRNNYQFFSAEMNARAHERLSVENYLRLALRRNELVLHYQPRMKVTTGELVGVEALVRWQHPRRGLLAPGKFIDVAEDSGLIVPIGEWVLDQACQQLRAWQRNVLAGLRLSVNLSVGQVVDGDRLYAAVAGALQRSAIEPAALELELTESLLMQNIGEKAELLHRLGDLGVGLAIDDFGTGYSSLSYLKALPVDSIKIDGSFVRDIHEDPDDEAIIRAIVAMAHSLRLSVTAEGVETEAQLGMLRDLGCDEYQGFHASAALAPAQFEARFARGGRLV